MNDYVIVWEALVVPLGWGRIQFSNGESILSPPPLAVALETLYDVLGTGPQEYQTPFVWSGTRRGYIIQRAIGTSPRLVYGIRPGFSYRLTLKSMAGATIDTVVANG